ncbi:MAG: cation diffusion facilitator family transporter [Hydrogenothermaceae bacterium]|nr:cation diffusion facilitator family transporter [Hydrogenothermaceae bacterium]
MNIVEHRLRKRDTTTPKKRVFIAIILNIMIVVLQLIYGFVSNSISLLTDALHNLQDVVSLIIALIAIMIVQKLPTKEMTFGFLRSEALAGFVNSLLLILAILTVIVFSVHRLINPEEVEGVYVILFGLVGFIANLVSAKMLDFHHHHEEEDHHHEDINIKAVYLHLLSDASISLGVFVGGVLIYLYKVYWVDPVLSILFSLYILKESISIIKKSYDILMEAVPKHIDVDRILQEMRDNFKDIKEIHDLHIWSLSSHDLYLSAHIVVEQMSIRDYDKLLEKLEKFFRERGINHITVQPESEEFRCEILH